MHLFWFKYISERDFLLISGHLDHDGDNFFLSIMGQQAFL